MHQYAILGFMSLIEHIQALYGSGIHFKNEKLVEINPWCVMDLMPDGSAILYKNELGPVKSMTLSRNELEFIKGMALPIRQFTPGPESEKDVHTEHCCVFHGCKYGDDDCPVILETKSQSYHCESCRDDAEGC